MCTIQLTQEQRNAVIYDMDNKTEMLSFEEIEALATELGKKITIPFLPEGTEQTILVKTVRLFDRLLYQNLPNELYSLVKNTTDGIEEKDLERFKLVLSIRLNGKFDIPYVPEEIEQQIFEFLISLTVNYMQKNVSILGKQENE